MEDLFKREQQIYDNALNLCESNSSVPFNLTDYETLTKEYGRLLKQLRRVTKISDKTTIDLNSSKLDLLNKVHFDALTGIYNRRFMDDRLKQLMRSLSRSGGLISVMMIDIDFFKKYNDTYGHQMGDTCLKTIAGTLNNSVTREEDFTARYGGEEFVVILPHTDVNGARIMADRLLENVRACQIPHEKNAVASCVTISIGFTTGQVMHSQKGAEYIKRADEALYMSKQNGRNRYTYINFKEESV